MKFLVTGRLQPDETPAGLKPQPIFHAMSLGPLGTATVERSTIGPRGTDITIRHLPRDNFIIAVRHLVLGRAALRRSFRPPGRGFTYAFIGCSVPHTRKPLKPLLWRGGLVILALEAGCGHPPQLTLPSLVTGEPAFRTTLDARRGPPRPRGMRAAHIDSPCLYSA